MHYKHGSRYATLFLHVTVVLLQAVFFASEPARVTHQNKNLKTNHYHYDSCFAVQLPKAASATDTHQHAGLTPEGEAITPMADPSCGTEAAPYQAVLVFSDPIDWYRDLQLITDVIMSGQPSFQPRFVADIIKNSRELADSIALKISMTPKLAR